MTAGHHAASELVPCTAIVPTLERPADLEACLASLRAATPAFAAILVADQGAPGAVRACVESFGATYLHLPERGLSRARNAALALARTPWLYFPDDDCTVTPGVLAGLAQVLADHPRTGFVSARIVTPGGARVMVGMDERARAITSPADALATVMSPGLFVAARVFERVGGFDESFGVGAEWGSGEESDLLFRALRAGEPGRYAPGIVVQHPEPFDARDRLAQRQRAYAYGRGWGALFAKHARESAREFTAMQAHYERRAIGGALVSMLRGDLERARRYWASYAGRREGWRAWRLAHGGTA